MDKQTKLIYSSYNAMRADAAQKLREADRLGIHLVANLILDAVPEAATLHLIESEQTFDFAWDLAQLLDADGSVIADIDTGGITRADGTAIPFDDSMTVWGIINELPERVPTVTNGGKDTPASEYTSWFTTTGSTATVNLVAAASEDA
jgi:hypothetical protein